MAFGNIATFYVPIAGSAGSSLWGTDVRKLLSSADATADSTTKTDHGTSGSDTRRTVDPYTTSTTDTTEANYGWAIAPSDMNSVSGARRFFPAGNHTATFRMAHINGFAITATLHMLVYRVGTAASGRTRTLLGSANGTVSLGALGAEVDGSATVSLSEVILEPDETIQYSFELTSQGVIITGDTVTLFTGTQSGTAARIVTPGLKVLADTTGTASGSGSATGSASKVLGTTGTAAGEGAATGAMSARADTTGTAAGTATTTGAASSVAGTVGTTSGSSTTDGQMTAVGAMTGTASGTSTAAGVLGATGGMTGSAAGVGDAAGVLGATAGTIGTAVGVGSAAGLASSVAGTVGSAAGTSAVTGLTSIVLGTVGTVNVSDAPSDYSPNDGLKAIADVVRHHETDALVAGATVKLVRDADEFHAATTTSDAAGAYSFARDTNDPNTYHVYVHYLDGATNIQGVSERGLVPA